MARLLTSIGAGVLVGVLYTASPLTLIVAAGCIPLFWLSRRGLDEAEGRALVAILATALAVRAAIIGAMVLLWMPHLNDLAAGVLSGDESYNLSRALRARDLVLGLGQSQYDHFVVTDQYGANGYVTLLSWLQWAFGPTPFSAKLLNALCFVTGATLLFRVARPAFGPVPAFGGLVALLAMPSLLYGSVTLVKDSAYFLASSVLLAASVGAFRHRTVARGVWALLVGAVSLWILSDLRRGALRLAFAGLACGLLMQTLGGGRRRIGAATVAAVLAVSAVVLKPALRDYALSSVGHAARQHSGHVFTVGHAYKLLDEGFYVNPVAGGGPPPELTPAQAMRFVVRGLISFVVTPLPWQVLSRSELAFLPEHLLWCAGIALLPFGLAAGWARNPMITSLMFCFALPTAITVALTTGNVGTLVRLRGLVTPFWIWISVLGLCQVIAWLCAPGRSRWRETWRPHTEGTPA